MPADFAPEGSAHLPFLLGATLEARPVLFCAVKKADKAPRKVSNVPQEQRTSSVTLGLGGLGVAKPP